MKIQTTNKPVIFGLFSGGKRMGKTYTANKIKEALEKKGHKVAVVSFAGAIRAISKDVLRGFGVPAEVSESLLTTDKDSCELGLSVAPGLSPSKRVSPRDGLLVGIGQSVRKYIGPDAWIDALWREVGALHSMGYTHMIIDDLRKPNEAKSVRQHGGTLVYVWHPIHEHDTKHEDYADCQTIMWEHTFRLAECVLNELTKHD